MGSFMDWLLYRLVAKKLGIKKNRKTSISSLPISDYSKTVFQKCEIETVEEGVMAYVLHEDTPGIGARTWEDFISSIS